MRVKLTWANLDQMNLNKPNKIKVGLSSERRECLSEPEEHI